MNEPPVATQSAQSLAANCGSAKPRPGGAKLIIGLVLLLIILYQDNWLWSNGALVFGILPIGLAWHVGISIAAAVVWFLASKIAWPADDEVQH